MHCSILRLWPFSSALDGTVAAQRSRSTRRCPVDAQEDRAKANRMMINRGMGVLNSAPTADLWLGCGRGEKLPSADRQRLRSRAVSLSPDVKEGADHCAHIAWIGRV